MFKMQRKRIDDRGNITLETTLVMGSILTLLMLLILVSFYLHDYIITASQADYHLIRQTGQYQDVADFLQVGQKSYEETEERRTIQMEVSCRLAWLGVIRREVKKSRYFGAIENIWKKKVLIDGIK